MKPLLQPLFELPPPRVYEEPVMPQHQPLTEVEEKFLRSIYDLRYLTIPQLALLHYKQATQSILNYVAAILKQLDDETGPDGKPLHKNYVQRGYLGHATRFARNPSVFRLATKGLNHIAELGLSPLPKFRPSDPFPSYEQLAHTLNTNDFIIAAKRLCLYTPGYQLTEVQHDWVLHHHPIYVAPEKKGERKVAVIPDAWLDFSLPIPDGATRQPRLPVHLELDRGTEDTSHSFKPKLYALLRYIDGPYEERFHTPHVTIAFATTRGTHRLERMRTWTEEVLREQNREADAPIFFFTTLPHKIDEKTGKDTPDLALDPQTLFLEPVWLTPFDRLPKPLLAYE